MYSSIDTGNLYFVGLNILPRLENNKLDKEKNSNSNVFFTLNLG